MIKQIFTRLDLKKPVPFFITIKKLYILPVAIFQKSLLSQNFERWTVGKSQTIAISGKVIAQCPYCYEHEVVGVILRTNFNTED